MGHYKLGKIKQIRTAIVEVGEEVDPYLIVTEDLDLTKYEDITSIENWVTYGSMVCTDFLQVRDRIKHEIDHKGGWTGLTNTEKDITIDYYARPTGVSIPQDNTNKVIHLMTTKGLTQQQATMYILQKFTEFNKREIQACRERAESKRLAEITLIYLNIGDAADFIRVTQTLNYLYKNFGIMGVNYGVSGEGLFDFIESTPGTQYEFTGLAQQGYTINNGTINDLINSIMDVLKYGNY
jgi:hypothetical protein